MDVIRRRLLKMTALGLGAGAVPARLLAQAMHMHMPAGKGRGNALCEHPAAEAIKLPPLVDPMRMKAFVDPLPIPPSLRAEHGKSLKLAMRESELSLHRDLRPARVWTYGGSMPGPTLELESGKPFRIEFPNELPSKHFLPIDHHIHGAEAGVPDVRAIVHLHGGRTPTSSDGYPDDWYVPGKTRVYDYPNQQDAATLWYHDHAMGVNRLNIYAGMFGLALLRDKHEVSLGLPAGEQEIPLLLCDRFITEDGQLYYPVSGQADAPWVPEVFGNAILVNGVLLPHCDVQPRRYRLRVLNTANARFFRLSLRGHRPFQQIGSDQGLLAAPVTLTTLVLAPGERADLIVDFATLAGQSIELMNEALPILQFRAGSGNADDRSKVPAVLREVTRTPESKAVRTRQLTLDEYDDCIAEPMLMLLDGKRWHEPVTEKPTLGSTEIWSFVNLTEDTHPIHLHLVRFQVLDRQAFDIDTWMDPKTLRFKGPPQRPPANEMGWKDVVQCYPGMVTRIIATFDGYRGKYAWHCHLLEHEANEMMRPFEVV